MTFLWQTLYLVPKEDNASQPVERTGFLVGGPAGKDRRLLKAGIHRFQDVVINGSAKERAVLNSQYSNENIDINLYDIVLKNLENITDSLADEFAVDVNSNN